MGKIPQSKIQEIIFASSEKSESRRITGLLKEKQIRKIAPRIYTSNLKESPAAIIKRNWYRILAHLFPLALLSYRSALEFKSTAKGHIFLTSSYPSKIKMPGLTVHFLKGFPKIEGDNPFFENLYASQEARAFLENLQETRKGSQEPKSLLASELEERLQTIIRD